MSKKKSKSVAEIALIGEIEDWEKDVIEALLEVPSGGECQLYIDSSGGSVYGALAVFNLLQHRQLRATAVVLGECSSATLLIFAACQKRQVSPHSAFLFHHMHWESEKRITSGQAVAWARHFEHLEKEMDELLFRLLGNAEQIRAWTAADRYVLGSELVAAGIADFFPHK
jgi:ATP-dependent Clp protease protease subunit